MRRTAVVVIAGLAAAVGAGAVVAQDAVQGAVRLPDNIDRLTFEQADPIARIETLHATVADLQREVATLRLEVDALKKKVGD